MSKIFLAPYSLRIRKKFGKEYLVFNDYYPTGILEEINKFLLGLQANFKDDPNNQSILRILKSNVNKTHYWINGIVETGEYGRESTFYDKKGTATYNRKADHAEVMPFYYLVGADGRMNKALILLQRFGQFGISRMLLSSLKSYLSQLNRSLTIDIEPVVSDRVLQDYIKKGDIRKVTFNKFELPADLASEFSERRKSTESPGYMSLSVIARKNQKFNLNKRLNDLIFGNKIEKLLSIKNFTPDETKVTIDYGGIVRTISIAELKFRAFYDVSNEVERELSNHPKFSSIDKTAKNLMSELFQMIT